MATFRTLHTAAGLALMAQAEVTGTPINLATWLLRQLAAAHAPVEVAPPTRSNQETIE